jgi:phosphohistidine phosphatase
MNLILMRHGKALDMGASGMRCDADRRLSDEGRRVTRTVAAALMTLEHPPGLVLASPLKRAVETAAILSECGGGLPLHECSALAPGGRPAELVEALRPYDHACVVAVGHMPDLSELAFYLLCASPRDSFVFKPSAACSIRFEGPPRAGAGTLEWLAPPWLLVHQGES